MGRKLTVRAIIFFGLLLLAVLAIFIWLFDRLFGLEGVRIFLTTVGVIFAIILLMLLGALLVVWGWLFVRYLSGASKQITVLPFETAIGEDKFTGRALADLFTAQWLDINRIHRSIVPNVQSEKIVSSFNLAPRKEDISNEVTNIVTAGVGQTKVSVGQLFISLRRLWPIGDAGITLTGSFQRYGEAVVLTMRMESSSTISVWEVGREVQSENDIPHLVRELTFKVFQSMSISEDNLPTIKAQTWEAFQHFTEARDAYRRYQIAGNLEDLDDARTNAILAVRAEPDYPLNFDLLIALGLAYEGQGDSRAEEMFRYATDRENSAEQPTDEGFKKLSDAFALLGWAQIKKGDVYSVPEAMFALQKATNRDPKSAFAWANLGIGYDAQGRFSKAVIAHARAIALESKDSGRLGWVNVNRLGSEGLATSAWWLSLQGYYDEAIRRCRWAINKATGNESYPPHVLMSELLTQDDRFREALSISREATRRYPKSTAPILAQVYVYWLLGEDHKAYARCQDAIDLSPRDAYPWLITGMIYGNWGEYDKAIAYYKKVSDLAPGWVLAHLSLAAVHWKKGNRTKFRQEVETSRQLLDQEGEYKYNRACFEAICGNVDEALALLKETLERKQVHPKWICRDPNLERIRGDQRFDTLVEQFQGEKP